MTPTFESVVTDFKADLQQDAEDARRLMRRYNAFHFSFGIAAILFSGVSGVTVLIAIGQEMSALGKLIAGGLAIAVSIVTGLERFVRPGVRGRDARIIAVKLQAAIRRLEVLLMSPPRSKSEKANAIGKLISEVESMASIISDAATVSDLVHESAYRSLAFVEQEESTD